MNLSVENKLFKAIENNSFIEFQKLLLENNKISLDIKDWKERTLLYAAVEENNIEILKLLIEKEKNTISINLFKIYINKLISAINKIIAFFLKQTTFKINLFTINSEIQYMDYMTPLERAINMRSFDCANYLIDSGASINIEHKSEHHAHWTPMFHAICRGNLQIVKKLLDLGDSSHYETYKKAIYFVIVNGNDFRAYTHEIKPDFAGVLSLLLEKRKLDPSKLFIRNDRFSTSPETSTLLEIAEEYLLDDDDRLNNTEVKECFQKIIEILKDTAKKLSCDNVPQNILTSKDNIFKHDSQRQMNIN